ncbi:MAG: hypothetical protein Q8P80_00860 [Candidatus Levybacteria bacterium]|nr:hypothetical protein [Candidatus Levybacteria bacterium]
MKIKEILKNSNISKNLKLIFVIAVIAAIPLTVIASQQKQEIRQRAAEPISGTCTKDSDCPPENKCEYRPCPGAPARVCNLGEPCPTSIPCSTQPQCVPIGINPPSVTGSGGSGGKVCPQFMPPSPDWCKDGKIIPGEINKDGCRMPPTCQISTPSPQNFSCDINRDGKKDSKDGNAVKICWVQGNANSFGACKNTDTNNDGVIDLADIKQLIILCPDIFMSSISVTPIKPSQPWRY